MLTHSHSCSFTLTHSHSLSLMLTQSHSCSLTLIMLTHSHSCSLTFTHAHSFSLMLSHSHSCLFTLTHARAKKLTAFPLSLLVLCTHSFTYTHSPVKTRLLTGHSILHKLYILIIDICSLYHSITQTQAST